MRGILSMEGIKSGSRKNKIVCRSVSPANDYMTMAVS